MIRLGPAGSPGKSTIEGISIVKDSGLDAMEVEFVYGIKMSNELAKQVGEAAKKAGVILSVHGPYYINLASAEKEKVEASVKRIIDSCERAHHLGARCVVFHAAFYGKLTKEQCYALVKKEVRYIIDHVKKKGWDVVPCPETTGKGSQFGDLDELVKLSKETGCGICVDFAHIKARNNGTIDYDEVMEKIKDVKELTCHFSGIEYTAKGERKHLLTPEAEIKKLLTAIVKHNINATVINESPDPLGDSIKAKKILSSIQ